MLDRFRRRFLIEIENGRAVLRQGTPPPGFVSACSDVARLHNVTRGQIEGLGQGRHARLKFSRNLPERVRQAIRNVWTPPPTPDRSGGKARG